jgi:release factor glutamine methyltransferase
MSMKESLAVLPRFDALTRRDEARLGLARALAAAGIDSADLDARVLLCGALGIGHLDLIREPSVPLGERAAILCHFAERRMNREPVSKILGYRDFWDIRIGVSAHVLDPRPDTEILVEAVLSHGASLSQQPLRLLDLGVGSGAILCALLRGFPGSLGLGIDLSPKACVTARENLAALGLLGRGQIACGNWTEALTGQFNVIVSNPPYIPSSEIAGLEREVRDHDPHLSLDGGDDGLVAYRQIIPRLPQLLTVPGLVAFEFGPAQTAPVARMLEAMGFCNIQAICDLAGRERILLAWRAKA